jgi:hypothetical protein
VLIHTLTQRLRDADGNLWKVSVHGGARSDGTWIGWLEFDDSSLGVRTTDRETTQSSADALRYWATGLEAVYLEGALARAR